MKRINSILAALTAATMTAPLMLTAFAETMEDEIWINVSVANAGEVEVADECIPVTDADGDGSFTVNDVIICTHDEFYDGGAAAGYKTKTTEWGDSIVSLWGVENGGSYGYTVNDQFAFSLSDPVEEDCKVYFYVYKDAKTYTDVYTYFDWEWNEDGELVYGILNSIVYDENWMPQIKPVEGAVITVNGERTNYVTDENGTVFLDENGFGQTGSLIVSAECDDMIIVPPVDSFVFEDPELTDEPIVTTEAIDGGGFHIVADWCNAVLVPGGCEWYYTYAYEAAEFSIEDESVAVLTDEHGSSVGMACVKGVAPGETTLTAVSSYGAVATYKIVVVDPATTTTVTTQTTPLVTFEGDILTTAEETVTSNEIITTPDAADTTNEIVTTTVLTTVTEPVTTTAPSGELPQTGNNDAAGMFVLIGTFVMTGTGFIVLKRSGILDSEE